MLVLVPVEMTLEARDRETAEGEAVDIEGRTEDEAWGVKSSYPGSVMGTERRD